MEKVGKILKEMEKKIENLEKERGELSNRLDQLTDEFNEISECMRPHRSFLKRSFMVLDSLASEEEKRCQDNARKVYIYLYSYRHKIHSFIYIYPIQIHL